MIIISIIFSLNDVCLLFSIINQLIFKQVPAGQGVPVATVSLQDPARAKIAALLR